MLCLSKGGVRSNLGKEVAMEGVYLNVVIEERLRNQGVEEA